MTDTEPPRAAGSPRRAAVLEAAAEVFVERGFDAATTRDIGERAGVLSGSLYHHFETKEEMLYELVRDVYAGVLAFVDTLPEGTGAARLRRVLEHHVVHLAANLSRTTLFLHEFRSLTDHHRAEIAGAEERYVAVVTGLIEDGIADGTLRPDLDPRLARMGALGAVNWVCRWFRPDGEWSPQTIATELASILLDGLANCTNAPTVP